MKRFLRKLFLSLSFGYDRQMKKDIALLFGFAHKQANGIKLTERERETITDRAKDSQF